MPASKRRRLARGIFEDAHGISVIYPIAGKPKETRFPLGTPLDRLKRWRTTQLGQHAELTPRDPRGSLARDIVRYLKRLKGQPGYKSERSHLRAWLLRWPRARRWELTTEKVELAIADWRQAEVAPRTIRHRCRALKGLFRRLDGPQARSPVDGAVLPPRPKSRPVSVDDGLINDVAARLRAHERAGVRRLRSTKTRARFLVLATTGRRPAELKRALPDDVSLERRVWFVRTAKGGVNTMLVLNVEMLAAWRLFITAYAWGEYDSRSFAKTLRRNGWPADVRPYNLRHTAAIALRTRGGDLGDVQHLLGHASLQTATEHYLHVIPARDAAVSAKMAGRFDAAAFLAAERTRRLPRSTSTKRPAQDAKPRDFMRKTDRPKNASGRPSRSSKSRKTA